MREASNANVGSAKHRKRRGDGDGEGRRRTECDGSGRETVVSAACRATSEGRQREYNYIHCQDAAVPLSDGQAATIATIAVSADGLPERCWPSRSREPPCSRKHSWSGRCSHAECSGLCGWHAGSAEIPALRRWRRLHGKASCQWGPQLRMEVRRLRPRTAIRQAQTCGNQQIGAAVTYEVTAGINSAVPRYRPERPTLRGQEILAALITDTSGNVGVYHRVCGSEQNYQYQIPRAFIRFYAKI